MKISRFSKVILASLVAFFALTALLTYISQSRYEDGLPLVQTIEAIPGIMQKTYDVIGRIEADLSQERTVYAPADLQIRAVSAVTGESSKTGDVLIEFDAVQAELALIDYKLQLETCQKAAETINDALLMRQNALQTAQLTADIAALEEILANGGVVAVRDCDILYAIGQNTPSVVRGQLLVRYIPFPTMKSIVFSLPIEEHPPAVGSMVVCDLWIYDEETETIKLEEEQRLPIVNCRAEEDAWVLTVAMDIADVYMHHGEQVPLTAAYVGTVEYPFVLPRDAVEISGRTGTIYVLDSREKVFGTQYFLRRMQVEVLAYDDIRVAIAVDPGAPAVRYAGRFGDGTVVRLW